MKTIHMILQGKGGVGKSMVSSILCQYLRQNGGIKAVDTDPVNQTLSGYKSLNVTELNIRNGDDIDPRQFDQLMELVFNADVNNVIIDNGAATFMPLCAWMVENQTVNMWHDEGLRVLLHCIVTGGQALQDTTRGLASLAKYFDIPIFVWLNRYFGEIAFGDKKDFEEFGVYEKYHDKISAIIKIPLKTAATFGKDLEELFARRQTFAEAADDATLPIMTRQRLKIWWSEMRQAIDLAGMIDSAK